MSGCYRPWKRCSETPPGRRASQPPASALHAIGSRSARWCATCRRCCDRTRHASAGPSRCPRPTMRACAVPRTCGDSRTSATAPVGGPSKAQSRASQPCPVLGGAAAWSEWPCFQPSMWPPTAPETPPACSGRPAGFEKTLRPRAKAYAHAYAALVPRIGLRRRSGAGPRSLISLVLTIQVQPVAQAALAAG